MKSVALRLATGGSHAAFSPDNGLDDDYLGKPGEVSSLFGVTCGAGIVSINRAGIVKSRISNRISDWISRGFSAPQPDAGIQAVI